jgi:SAM-dependent methyltransferase
VDIRELVTGHYGDTGLADRILETLREAGTDVESLRVGDLAPVDQLHAGGAAATEYVLERLDGDADTRLLDVGCGVGGPARLAAASGIGTVTGVDLTEAFVEAAEQLTGMVGLGDTVSFRANAGEELPFDDGSFDAAMMIHVGMNIPDKQAVFIEVRRVLVPGGRFVIYDQMRCGDGDLPFPLPWAVDARSSFVESPHDYAGQLTAVGFEVEDTVNRTRAVAGGPGGPGGPPGAMDQTVLFGSEFARRIDNNIAATKAGDLGAVVVVARAI